MKAVVLFDGDCNFCNQSVQFIIARDDKLYFNFASLRSAAGKKLLAQYQLPNEINSIVVIADSAIYFKADAVLFICKHLRNPWPFVAILRIIPRAFRDFCYDIIAKHRYRLFTNRNERCLLPSEEIKERFLK